MGKYFRLFIVIVLVSSCNIDEVYEDAFVEPTLSLDGRLPLDENGYYHLQLDSSRNQTIHRITGNVLYTNEPTKVSWESNLYWWLLKEDTIANITHTYINEFTGQLTYVNLPPLTNWKDMLVPTINSTSYVGNNGEINTIIAPIYCMRYDTLSIKATINEWDIIQTIKIVLE